MMGLPILDVAIGMAFLYLLFALMCTTLNEIIANALNRRAKMLQMGLLRLLGSEDLVKTLYEHPAIASLAPLKGKALPSYIPAQRFAEALLDQLTGANPLTDLAAAETGIQGLPQGVAQQLKALLPRSGRSPDEFHKNIQEWYDQTMDRVTGWYKRYVQKQTFVLATILVLLLNLDTTQLIQRLWSDPTLRATVVEQAKARIEASGGTPELPIVEYTEPDKTDAGSPVPAGTATFTDSEKELLASLTGWATEFQRLDAQRQLRSQGEAIWLPWLGRVLKEHLLGWILTVVALSLGAPFWFDTLNRFMNLRNAGRAPTEPRSKAKPAGEANHA